MKLLLLLSLLCLCGCAQPTSDAPAKTSGLQGSRGPVSPVLPGLSDKFANPDHELNQLRLRMQALNAVIIGTERRMLALDARVILNEDQKAERGRLWSQLEGLGTRQKQFRDLWNRSIRSRIANEAARLMELIASEKSGT